MKQKTSLVHTLLFTLLGVLAACQDDATTVGLFDTPGITRVTDLNDHPDIVEVFLIAGVGETRYLKSGPAQVWAYRDGARPGLELQVPGPLIEAKQGDKVIVHFRNDLPEGTTIHWHGLRVPNHSDGTPSTQHEVLPGAEFRYEFVAHDEGTFWYHPHVRGDTQVERGLYGMVVVRGGPRVPVTRERALVLDDVKLTSTGALSDSTTSLDIMLGRLGNFIVANGIVDGSLRVERGARERWRIVNTANGRYFNLRLPGHVFQVIGWDGGLLKSPYETETLLVAPGERYDLIVELRAQPGAKVPLETIHYDRGHGVPDPGPQRVVTLDFVGDVRESPGPLPPIWGAPVDLMPPADARLVELDLDEESINGGEDVRFTINEKAWPDGLVLHGRSGEVAVWTVHNESEMDHPFHLHGMFFRVLDVNGIPPMQVGWKDTVNVPKESALRFVVQYGDPGTWMYHCHILEHAERGMMGDLKLSQGHDESADASVPHSEVPDAGVADGAVALGMDAMLPDGATPMFDATPPLTSEPSDTPSPEGGLSMGVDGGVCEADGGAMLIGPGVPFAQPCSELLLDAASN